MCIFTPAFHGHEVSMESNKESTYAFFVVVSVFDFSSRLDFKLMVARWRSQPIKYRVEERHNGSPLELKSLKSLYWLALLNSIFDWL